MKPLVIVGVGGFGRETHDVIDAINAVSQSWEVLGYLDDAPATENRDLVVRRGSRILGGVDWLRSAPSEVSYVVGIGNTAVRRRIVEGLQGRAAATLVHPNVVVGHDVQIGEGSVVCAGSVLTTHIRAGRHVHINPLCSVGHDAVMDDFVSINPHAAISGWVHLAAGSYVGAHATVLQNLTVHEDAVVGAAACVVKDVPAGQTVKGVPAR